MKNIVILISGRGSNMQAIVEAAIPNARIAAVLSNRADAAGLAWAAARGVATDSLEHKAFGSRLEFDQAMMQKIDAYQPDLVVLAGFMRILSAGFVQHYAGRLINIHPSLLPAFRGAHAIEQALEYGVKVFGVTIHYVDAELDGGRIIAQRAFPYEGDDIGELEAMIHAVEYPLYIETIKKLIE